ncbi:MAG: hypothetical protein ACK4N5_10585 [Myxococcales bacterium]
MSSCPRCAAPRESKVTLFCGYCGARFDAPGVRLLEAVAIETAGDVAFPIFPYGTLLPASWSDGFGAAEDGQRSVQVRLVVGNSARASECRTLLNVVVPLSRPLARAEAAGDLELRVDASGRVALRFLEAGSSRALLEREAMVPVLAPDA